MNNLEERQLEQMYRKEQHFFYEKVKDNLSNVANPFKIIDTIEEKVKQNRDLTEHEFEIIGSYSYLFGLDFSSMLFFNKNMQEKLVKRLSEYTEDMDEFFVQKLVRVINDIKNENIVNAKDSMINKIDKELNISSFDQQKHIMEPYRKLFQDVIIDIKYAVDCVELSSKNKITYSELLKVNNSINETFKYVGYKSMNSFRNMFSSEIFVDSLKKASKVFDDVKFATIYYDSILTINEKLHKYDDLNNVTDFICGKYNDEDYKKFEEEFVKTKEEHKEKEETKVEKAKQKALIDDEASKKLMQDNPIQFLMFFTEDCFYNNSENLPANYQRGKDYDKESFFKAFDIISRDDDDFLKDFYHWLKGSKNYTKQENKIEEPFNIDAKEILEETKSIIENKNAEYKKQAEEICKDIPENDLKRIKQMFDNVISGLILETHQQKQYIMSNFFENQIKTYQNLVQLLQLVESCEIKGSYAKYYKELSDYVRKLPFDFDITKDIDKSFKDLSLYNALREFLEDFIEKSTKQQ